MKVFHPCFVPFYLGLIVFLVYYAFSMAKAEETNEPEDEDANPFRYLGLVFIACGFGSVRYIEWSKKFQYKPYTREEVREHDSLEKGVWLIVEGDVFDVTPFVKKHPPGADKIMKRAGTDATKFFAFHLDSTKHFWRRSKIGWIVDRHDNV